MQIKSVSFTNHGHDYKIIIFNHGTMFVMDSTPGFPAKRIDTGPIYELARDIVGTLKAQFERH